MSRRRGVVAIFLCCAAAACHAAAVPPSFDSFVDSLAAQWMRANPGAATAQQYFTGDEQDALDRQLLAYDAQYGMPLDAQLLLAYQQRARAALQQLKLYPRKALDPVQRASAASLEWQLNDAVHMASVADQRYVFEQFRGLHVALVGFLTQVHPIRNARDVENYLERLRLLAPVLDEGIVIAKARAAKGTVPPEFILSATIEGIDRFLKPAATDNILVSSLAQRMAVLEGLSTEMREAAVNAATERVQNDIRPVFLRIRDLLVAQQAVATDAAGLWHLPNGSRAYAAMLHVNTTTDMTAAQIHALGLREVARIEAEMDEELRKLKLTDGSVQSRYDALDASLQPPPSPDPRPLLMAEYQQILRDAEVRATELFELRPKAPVQVLREPPFTEKNAAAHYSNPAPDGSRPGAVFIPLPGPPYKMLEMRTLMYHEGIPGHHFQIALQQELADIPPFRRKRVFGGLAAFSEGWGLYAEQLAVEAGWYRDDPKGHLGQLSDELFRARRLVADTGLHALRWTRQQAIDYGIPVAEVERYVVMPAQACAYKIGELQILAQRDKARVALEPKFSLKKFHDLLLRTGTVPLSVLAQVVDDDIAASRHASPKEKAP